MPSVLEPIRTIWQDEMGRLRPFTLNNDLRIADAHNAGETLAHLENLGFDIASVNQGFGRALDYVFDAVISAFSHVNDQAEQILNR